MYQTVFIMNPVYKSIYRIRFCFLRLAFSGTYNECMLAESLPDSNLECLRLNCPAVVDESFNYAAITLMKTLQNNTVLKSLEIILSPTGVGTQRYGLILQFYNVDTGNI